jgi:hypothetical protein
MLYEHDDMSFVRVATEPDICRACIAAYANAVPRVAHVSLLLTVTLLVPQKAFIQRCNSQRTASEVVPYHN